MKKEYKKPQMEVVKIEQIGVILEGSPGAHNGPGNGNQFAPGYGGKGRGRYAEDNLDEEDDEDM